MTKFPVKLIVSLLLLQLLSSNAFSIHSRCLIHSAPSASTQLSNQHHASYRKKISATPLMSTLHALEEQNDDEFSSKPTYGGLVRQMTGFSLSAMRASIRATTGLSLTASRTALRLFTGISATSILKTLASVFPPWFRYFLQPLFIIYYTPLMVLKYFIGSTKSEKEEAFAAHEKVIEGWKDAIRASEQAQENFALHVNEDGTIENLVPNSLSITDAIVQSLDIASTVKEKNDEQN